ncbi:MBL fold metallo-hydrolase [Microbaculum sp. FT89]|uniref:MBL fold metallo-hydrolase n=1 Tax=Microbaculum sp. FT89 TaxID=3447298 RepID=UPI003F538C7B
MDFRRRQFLKAGFAAGAAFAGSALGTGRSVAAQPKAARQVPGIYRIAVGDIVVTAILDGYVDLGTNMFPDATPDEVERLQRASFAPAGDTVRASVNCFVINTGDTLAIIDAGGRDFLGPTMGDMPRGLAAAGIDPANVDVVIATHMHPDHIGGIATKNGAAAFANAQLVVCGDDWDFWMSPENLNNAAEVAKPFFHAAQAAATPYAKTVRKIGPDEEVVPGIRSVALPGHTPGHTGYMVSSGNDTLFVWGDIVHSPMLQFPHPNWSIALDTSPQKAIMTRRKAFDMAVADRLMVAGMHLPYPGIGHVVRSNGFRFVPADWVYTLQAP